MIGRQQGAAGWLIAAIVVALAAPACSGGDDASTTAPSSEPPASTAPATPAECPSAIASGWQRWANRVDETVYCPTFMPSPVTAEIGGQWNTAIAPGRSWQLGFTWLEHDDLVHIVFEAVPRTRWPISCEGVPCFDDRTGTERIGDHEVTWYDRNEASHSGHIAAVFRSGGMVQIVSMHVYQPHADPNDVEQLVREMVAGLVPVTPAV